MEEHMPELQFRRKRRKVEARTCVSSPWCAFVLCTVPSCIRARTGTQKEDGSKDSITDFTWLFLDSRLTCWSKFHSFYEPQKLFTSVVNKLGDSNFEFTNVRIGCDLYKSQCTAFCMLHKWGGGRKHKQEDQNAGSEAGKADDIVGAAMQDVSAEEAEMDEDAVVN